MAKAKLNIIPAPAEAKDLPAQPTAGLRKFNKAEEQVTKAVATLKGITRITNQEQLDSAMANLKSAKAVEKVIEDKRTELVKPHNDEVKRINAYAKELTARIPPAVQAVKILILMFHEEEERKVKAQRTAERVELLRAMGFVPVPDDGTPAESYAYGTSVNIQMFSIENEDDALWNLRITRASADIGRLKAELLKSKNDELEEVTFFGSDDEKAALQEEIAELTADPEKQFVVGSTSAPGHRGTGLTKRWTYEVTDLTQVPRGYLQLNEKAVREAVNSGARSIPGLRIFQDKSITIR